MVKGWLIWFMDVYCHPRMEIPMKNGYINPYENGGPKDWVYHGIPWTFGKFPRPPVKPKPPGAQCFTTIP